MKVRHHPGCRVSAVATLLLGVAVGCGEASSEGGPELTPPFSGEVPESPGAQEAADGPNDEADMAPAAPTGEGLDSSEGPGMEDIPLQPGEEEDPAATDGEEPSEEGEPVDPEEMAPEEMVPEEMAPEEPDDPLVFEPLQKFVGNITTGNGVDTNGLVFSDYWDQITPENAGKWGSVQNNANSARNWNALDAIYDYSQENGIIFKEHTFVWGAQQPGGNLTAEDVRGWMSEFCTRYPATRLIDVVNEPPPHTEPSYAQAMGGGTNGDWRWVANAFEWAREFCPNAILILNDYNNIEFGNQTDNFIDIALAIQALGAPIDAVGAQAHGLSNGNTGNMINLLNRLHDQTGLPVYITEYDINLNDDAAQLDRVQQHFRFFLDTEWIEGVTIWGWIFGRTWVANSGLVRNGNSRPAMVWLMEELGRPVP